LKSRNPLKVIVLAPIVVWSRWISPGLPPRCKYEASCSRYAIQAIEELGILRGLVLAVWRVLRCNPWSHGGVDKVADQGLFKTGQRQTSCQHEVITQR
jgi:putative membrane protein insertion efficiency factor